MGQNVNSYNDVSLGVSDTSMTYTEGFRTIYRPPPAGRRFPELVDAICRLSPNLRVRFTSPHPKDFPDDLISLYGQHANLCPQIHLPAQSEYPPSSFLQFQRKREKVGFLPRPLVLVHWILQVDLMLCWNAWDGDILVTPMSI